MSRPEKRRVIRGDHCERPSVIATYRERVIGKMKNVVARENRRTPSVGPKERQRAAIVARTLLVTSPRLEPQRGAKPTWPFGRARSKKGGLYPDYIQITSAAKVLHLLAVCPANLNLHARKKTPYIQFISELYPSLQPAGNSITTSDFWGVAPLTKTVSVGRTTQISAMVRSSTSAASNSA